VRIGSKWGEGGALAGMTCFLRVASIKAGHPGERRDPRGPPVDIVGPRLRGDDDLYPSSPRKRREGGDPRGPLARFCEQQPVIPAKAHCCPGKNVCSFCIWLSRRTNSGCKWKATRFSFVVRQQKSVRAEVSKPRLAVERGSFARHHRPFGLSLSKARRHCLRRRCSQISERAFDKLSPNGVGWHASSCTPTPNEASIPQPERVSCTLTLSRDSSGRSPG
jgi:hypothetical protein